MAPGRSPNQGLIDFFDPEAKRKDGKGRTLDQILGWNDDKLEDCHDFIQTLFPLPEPSMIWGSYIIDEKVFEAFRLADGGEGRRRRLAEAFDRIAAFYGFAVERGELVGNGKGKVVEEEEEEEEEEGSPRKKAKIEDAGDEEEEVDTRSDDVPHGGDQKPSESTRNMDPENKSSGDQKKDADASLQHKTQQNASRSKPPPENQDISHETIHVVRAPNWKQNFYNWRVPHDHNHLRISRILRSLRVLGLENHAEAFYEALMDACDNDDAPKVNAQSRSYWKKAMTGPLYKTPRGETIKWLKDWTREQA